MTPAVDCCLRLAARIGLWSLEPFPPAGGRAHRPLIPLCAPSPSAWPTLTPLLNPFPSLGRLCQRSPRAVPASLPRVGSARRRATALAIGRGRPSGHPHTAGRGASPTAERAGGSPVGPGMWGPCDRSDRLRLPRSWGGGKTQVCRSEGDVIPLPGACVWGMGGLSGGGRGSGTQDRMPVKRARPWDPQSQKRPPQILCPSSPVDSCRSNGDDTLEQRPTTR